MNKARYTLVRVYYKQEFITRTLASEEIDCKTLKDAVELGTILTEEEKVLGSYIFDNVSHKRLTLKGEY